MVYLSMFTNAKPRFNAASGAVVLLTVLATLLGSASGEYETSGIDGNGNGLCSGVNCGERGGGVSGAMWFGPRLGRRRRSEERPEGLDDEQINAIADALVGSSWNLAPLQGTGDKRRTNQFTPRLGRESGEEMIQKYILMGDNARLARLIEGQEDLGLRQLPPPPPPPFAPRLGRHLAFNPSPRLGRRLRALLQKL